MNRPILTAAAFVAASTVASPAMATYAHRHTCGCGHVTCTTTTSGSSTTNGGTTTGGTTTTTTSTTGGTTTSTSSGGSTSSGTPSSRGSTGGDVPEPGMFGLLGLGLLGVGLARYRSRSRG